MTQRLSVNEFAAFQQAIVAASLYRGATAPNPTVGAAALDQAGNILSVKGHPGAGKPHAEAWVLEDLKQRGLWDKAQTLIVTLEPCNHWGRTAPCAEAILASSIKRIVIGAKDPNPKVAGGGAARLIQEGRDAIFIDPTAYPPLYQQSQSLIAPFAQWSTRGLPWVTVKTAHQETGSMIPPPGQHTFTSPESLRFAHELRRRADAIITGSGTVLTDQPELTVRHVPDHPGKRRELRIFDRRHRVPEAYFSAAQTRGFNPARASNPRQTLLELAQVGCLEVLIEAGPELTKTFLDQGLWNEHIQITQQSQATPPLDRIEITLNPDLC